MDDTDEQLNVELDALTSAVDDHAAALKLRDVDTVSRLLDDVLIENGLTIPAHRRREFALALLQARLKTLEVGVKGEIRGERVEDQGVSVDGLLDAYLAERKLGSKSEFEVRAAYRRFTAIVGGGKPAREVSKADCRKDGKLSPVSVKKLLGICATVYRYGVGQGHLDVNPFEGITRIVRGDAHSIERRLPYDSADLTAIFDSPEFSKLTGAKRWFPLIATLSGCRAEEVAGLRVQDVSLGRRVESRSSTSCRLPSAGSRTRHHKLELLSTRSFCGLACWTTWPRCRRVGGCFPRFSRDRMGDSPEHSRSGSLGSLTSAA
jgi:hypothetical protein